ncbi:alcohol dehydrogenase GroES-like domain-containing protein [Periconia macrospinosa]|uniref:Alcohol dehydrogenase GroES-like domain-containing protein n=1 Tax=Periconia macrospinosa TaxID=97972 RepID=A0A2V1DM76_9PLEO|nr:alcohol dehydrogenase GroES-like domain-containing protein [Periconia macrospinosa]
MSGNKESIMRAVVWEGKPYEVAVRDWPKPTIRMPEDAIVQITTAGLCGTDLHIYHGMLSGDDIPFTLGHEGVGIVVEVGNATEEFKVGDRVLIPCIPDDGHFELESTAVPNLISYGLGELSGNLGGCQAEYVRVPFADDSLVKIPKNSIHDLDYLLLTDILPTAWTALNVSGFQPGESVAVFGAGPVGLLCAHLALVRGALRVYSIDHVQDRLDKAASIGAIPINFADKRKGTASQQILAQEPGGVMRSCDCVGYECVNPDLKIQSNYIIQEATIITSTGGGIGVVGVYNTMPSSIGSPNAGKVTGDIVVPVGTIMFKELSLRAGIAKVYELIPIIKELVEAGRVNPRFIYTNEVGIEDAPLAYKRFSEQKEIKIAFRFPWQWEPQPYVSQVDQIADVDMKNVAGNGELSNGTKKIEKFKKQKGKWVNA